MTTTMKIITRRIFIMPPFEDFCRGEKKKPRMTKEGRGRRGALLRRRKSFFPVDGMGISVAPMRQTDWTTMTRRRRKKRHRRCICRGCHDIRLLQRRSVFQKVGRWWRCARRKPQTGNDDANFDGLWALKATSDGDGWGAEQRGALYCLGNLPAPHRWSSNSNQCWPQC